MTLFLQVFLTIVGPYLGIRLLRLLPNVRWISPVVWSYGLGILLANTQILPIHTQLSNQISQAAILFAIPMLLYSTDLLAWFRHARSTVFSFGCCIIGGLFSSTAMAYIFQDLVENTWRQSAMLVGVYTGGTPNLNAIGLALEASQNTFILLNASDTVCGIIYLLFLTSIAPLLLAKIFPPFQTPIHASKNSASPPMATSSSNIQLFDLGQIFLLTLGIIGASLAITYGCTGALDNIVWIILLLTTFSVLASLSPKVRQIKGSFELGEYLLLIFCVAIGLLADLSKLVAEGGTVLFFTTSVMFLAIGLHYILAVIFRIDRDTVMITSTAAIMGPVFIGQIASVLNNKDLVFSGMATGLMGYAIGNYLGIGLGYALKWFILP